MIKKLQIYKLKKQFLSKEHKEEGYNKYLAFDKDTNRTITIDPFNVDEMVTTNIRNGFNGEVSESELSFYYGGYSNGKSNFEWLFGEFNYGEKLMSIGDWLKTTKREFDSSKWVKECTIEIELNDDEINYFKTNKKEIDWEEIKEVEDGFDLTYEIDFLGDAWDFTPPVEAYPQSKELQNLTKLFERNHKEEMSDDYIDDGSYQKELEKIFNVWTARIKEIGKVFYCRENNEFYNGEFKKLKLSEIFN